MAVDSCGGPVQGVSTSSRVQVWCFGGYPTVDSRQSMGALGGCRHAWLADLGVSTPSRVQGVVFWTVDSQWQPLGLSGRVVGRFRGDGDIVAGPGSGVLGSSRLSTVDCSP